MEPGTKERFARLVEVLKEVDPGGMLHELHCERIWTCFVKCLPCEHDWIASILFSLRADCLHALCEQLFEKSIAKPAGNQTNYRHRFAHAASAFVLDGNVDFEAYQKRKMELQRAADSAMAAYCEMYEAGAE